MFGSSNPFGQSSSSPFGSQTQSVFGQNNNASSNPFAAKPFGTSSPFGAQTGSSMFGGTSAGVFGAPQASSPFGAQTGSSMFGGNSTGVFGAPQASSPFGAPQASSPFGAPQASSPFGAPQASSPFGAPQASSPFGSSSQGFGSSTPAFGASSAPAFGASSAPAFGASSAPAFGNSAAPFGGSSNFGQKSFGFSTPQSSPFGSTAQQSQPAFGNSTFGSSTPFGASSTPAFGATSTPAFGSTNTSAFGASSTPSFGASSSPAFGASPSPAFGTSGTAFGNNAFGSGGGFGASSTSAFGASSTPAFGSSSTPAFGSSSTPAFGVSSSPSFSFGSSPAFGQSSSSFGSTQSPFGAQGAQASTPMFAGQTNFGVQQGGSRVIPYAPTTEADSGNAGASAGKLQSISAMPVHKDKTHEELRWEDYQRGDKGGQLPAGQSPGGAGFGVSNSQPSLFPQSSTNPFSSSVATNPFSSSVATNSFSSSVATNPFSSSVATNPFSSSVATNSFSSSIATNPFAQKAPIATTNFSSPFGQTPTPSGFGSTSSTNTSLFGPSPGFSNTVQPFGSSSTTGFASSPSMFVSGSAQGSSPAFNISGNLNNSQSSPLFSSNPSIGQPSSQFGQTSSLFGPTSSPFGQNNNPAFPQTSNFSTPSTGMGSLFPNSSSLTTSNSPFGQSTAASLTSFQSAQPTQPLGGFSLNNFSQTQTANTNGFSGAMGSFSQGNFGQVPATTNSAAIQLITVANPFGTLPALPQMSIAQGGNSPSIQYGISSMPVVDKPASVRVSPLLTSRHLLQRRVKLPARKYRPGDDGPKVPFFSDEENSNTPRADALFIPRENPRALFIRPVEKEKSAPPMDGPSPLQENGKSSNNGVTNGANHENKNNGGETRDAPPVKVNQKPNRTLNEKKGSNGSPSGADIESVMPKLHHAEYFTEPRIQELAAKERANPGYCGRVKDFVVGRHGYGSIKFLGETDVRKLDLEMLVQFNNREVIVYMDETQKPPVGQGLNKPAEVTLLNIKCIDKKTGKQLKEGPRVDKYKEMLKRKAEEQGAKFVSFDAEKGEWKFSVEHFSSYKLGDEDDE